MTEWSNINYARHAIRKLEPHDNCLGECFPWNGGMTWRAYQSKQQSGVQVCYPLVNVHKTMENHHFYSWVNPLFLWPFVIAFCMFTRGYINYIHICMEIICTMSAQQSRCRRILLPLPQKSLGIDILFFQAMVGESLSLGLFKIWPHQISQKGEVL